MDLLDSIRQRLEHGHGLSEAEGLFLYESVDLLELGRMAGDRTPSRGVPRSIIPVRRIRVTNICRNQCPYCHRASRPGEQGAFTRSSAEVVDLVGEAVQAGIDQIQLVAGTNPDEPYAYYTGLVSAVRQAFPDVHIQAFAPAQMSHIAEIGGVGVTEALRELMDLGLNSIPENGAAIFDPEIRRQLCPAKVTGGAWLQVMREAHALGMVTGACMLYGHYERPVEKLEHLTRLRDLQDETHGFSFYAPRAFRPNERTNGSALIGGTDDLVEFAVGRLFMDTFPHIRCYATDLGMKTTQISLHFGVDTIAVTVRDGEPLADDERAATGMPNATQLAQLVTNSGYEVRPATLDQRYAVADPAV